MTGKLTELLPDMRMKHESRLTRLPPTLTHSLIVEQCRKGQGYPVVISEVHEQAVLSGRDRSCSSRWWRRPWSGRG